MYTNELKYEIRKYNQVPLKSTMLITSPIQLNEGQNNCAKISAAMAPEKKNRLVFMMNGEGNENISMLNLHWKWLDFASDLQELYHFLNKFCVNTLCLLWT